MARPRSAPPGDQERLIFDTGAVLALAQRDPYVRGMLRRAQEFSTPVAVPAVVLAEVVRGNGPRDAPVNQAINAIGKVTATTEAHGRLAGKLLGSTRSDHTIGAMVVAEAILGGGGWILTSDPDDLGMLSARHSQVAVRAVR